MRKLLIITSSLFIGANAIAQTMSPGINLSYIDSSANPRNDFFKYANGKWLKTQQIPASDGSWGSFNEINERNLANLKAILLDVSIKSNATPGSNEQKTRDLY